LILPAKINNEIINAQPTDGLWNDDRTDEDQLGATYEELEWSMDYIDNNKNEILDKRQKEVIEIFLRFRKNNQHKMLPIPVFKSNS
jgi:NAD+ synthase